MAAADKARVNQLRNNITRAEILWYGTEPRPEVVEQFEHRQLTVRVIGDLAELTAEVLPVCCGIVLEVADRPRQLREFFERFAETTANHGLLHCFIANNATEQARIRSLQPAYTRTIDRRPTAQSRDREDFRRVLRPAPHEVPELLARWNPGPGRTEVAITGDAVSAEQRLFFQRAFSDCRSISISRLPGGRSATVFCVYAQLADDRIGVRPLPFFAKIDSLEKIERERQKYDQFVSSYIPFHLRPDLDDRRCLRGARRGMLVGDFVERSEPLRAVASRGHAQSAIYSLFENALAGLRLQAYPRPAVSPTLWEKLQRTFDPGLIERNSSRLQQAMELGARTQPRDLLRSLQGLANMPVLVAPMHGDLHGYNVRVRGGDAILIDFNSMRAQMPLTFDPASLEVSLVFGFGEPAEPVPNFETWRRLVDQLYWGMHVFQAPPPPQQPNEREWIWSTVRQIRQIALSSQIEPGEYGPVLAAYLLRYATFDNDTYGANDPRSRQEPLRRAYAYVIGDRLTIECGAYAAEATRS